MINLLNSKEPSHPVTAFFDVDDTLITLKSMFDFFDYWASEKKMFKLKKKFHSDFKLARAERKSREELNKIYYQFFAGQSLSEITKLGLSWYESNILHKGMFIEKTVQRLKEHKLMGHKIVFVSGSMMPLLKPIADYLNADDLLCTELIIDEQGMLTGNIGPIQTIGVGKSNAINLFALENDVDLSTSYAYGDDISDMNMLLAVGHPVYVGEQPAMLKYAQENHWEILI